MDASILAKLLRREPESRRIAEIIEAEDELVVSALARLETLVVIDAWVAGGLSQRQAALRRTALDSFRRSPPFRFVTCRTAIFELAETQLASAYCPTLDRLHLAVMQDLRLRRLFTNDDQQAKAAQALGFEVILPR